jgi:hypothetical protein
MTQSIQGSQRPDQSGAHPGVQRQRKGTPGHVRSPHKKHGGDRSGKINPNKARHRR